MDNQMIQQAVQWVQQNVGEQTSKQELNDKAQGSDLPGEVKDSIREMPEGQHSKQDVISFIQQKLMSKLGAGVGGMGGFGL